VAEFVSDALAKGAKLECGGTVPNGKGFFYPPTVHLERARDRRLRP
jgi:succinate-semialdehyde dehydrogenase/glutarate-semialdehyde dehydrogenase